MVGRRRRGTSSSTESAVPDQLRYRPEASVLKPVPFDTPENNWPTFELDDAVILSKDGRELENALDVILKGPFIVRGRMIVEDQEQRSHLVSRVRAPVPIEIWPCQRYSIGETEGGKMSDDGDEDSEADARPILSVLWVSGQGGWFEVNPAPAYIPIYRDICDAIKLFYALFDIYQNADAKFKKAENGERDPTGRLAPLFMKYAVRVGSGITFEEVEKRCLDVAPFLISQFLDDINFWKKTYLYQWFKETHEVGSCQKNMRHYEAFTDKATPRTSSRRYHTSSATRNLIQPSSNPWAMLRTLFCQGEAEWSLRRRRRRRQKNSTTAVAVHQEQGRRDLPQQQWGLKSMLLCKSRLQLLHR